MTRLLGMMPLVAIFFGGCDRVSDPWSNTPPAEYSDLVWANPPNCAAGAPGVSLPAAQHDSLPPFVPQFSRLEDVWRLVAAHVPGGWAGFAYPEGASLVIPTGQMPPRKDLLFVDTTHMSESLDSLAVYYPLYFPNLHFSFQRDSVGIRTVRWSWEQLHDWYRYLNARLPGGVLRASISFDDSNRLSFGVATAADHAALLQRFSQLGVPCWLAQVYIGGGGGAKGSQSAPGIAGP